MQITIRKADTGDTQRLLGIYSYYVTNTAITFEYDVPSVSEFARRIQRISAKYPYITAESSGRIIGYAYAGVFKDRAAYDHSVEVTIYIDKSEKGKGVGRLLYSELEKRLREMGITNLYACIGIPSDKSDEFLDFNSMQFHEHMGYTLAGRFHKCGYKFGRWYDMVWLEKIIGEHRLKQEHTPTPQRI